MRKASDAHGCTYARSLLSIFERRHETRGRREAQRGLAALLPPAVGAASQAIVSGPSLGLDRIDGEDDAVPHEEWKVLPHLQMRHGL